VEEFFIKKKRLLKHKEVNLFFVFYFLLALILWILALPYLLYKSLSTKYKQSIPARFFLKNNSKFQDQSVWFHTCSLGETKSIANIVKQFDNVNMSVNTNTGFQEAKKLTSNVRYLPYELFLPFWITKQNILVVMEAELWYMLFFIAKRKDTPTMLINARISDKSYDSYKKFSWLYKKIFENIDYVFAQSKIDKHRLQTLGAKNIKVIGNIKLANLPTTTKDLVKPNKTVIVAASTHENEEQLILDVYKKEYGVLVVVPRHPERFEKVDQLIKEYINDKDLTYHRYSQKNSFDSDIVLVDCLGELINIYAISDVVILGGAFEDDIGGHNPIEPAYFNTKLISGKKIFNQKSLFECVNDYVLIENNELEQTLEQIDSIAKSSIQKVGDIDPIIEAINRYNIKKKDK
jgi:3-deoxy-D-manno-octulosonic-acid transferase